jgi:glycine hydroxymethyltransferase
MELSHGGHISHGHQSSSKKISEASHRFTSIPYHTNPDTGIIDYDEVEALALQHRPRIITTGYSAYCRLIDFARLRGITEKVNAYLHCDMAHICGLIASQLIPSPFPYCDVVTTTTYKTMRGPQGAMIFSKAPLSDRINRTLFPRFQAGIGFANILAMAVALRQLQTQELRQQQRQFLESARVMAQSLLKSGYRLVSGGTDIHMMLIDLRNKGIRGAEAEKVLEMANIICNRNSIPGDRNGACSGLRLATPQMTIRGMDPSQAGRAAEFVHHGIQLAQRVSRLAARQAALEGSNNPKDFENLSRYIERTQEHQEILELRSAVAEWVKQYPPPALVE